MRGVSMRKADMTGLDLSYADLSNAHLENAIMNATVLYRTNLSSAKLTDTMLFNTDLQQVSKPPPPSVRPSPMPAFSPVLQASASGRLAKCGGCSSVFRHTESPCRPLPVFATTISADLRTANKCEKLFKSKHYKWKESCL